MLTASKLLKELSPLLTFHSGDQEQLFSDICPVESIQKNSLVFCSSEKQWRMAFDSDAKGVVAPEALIQSQDLKKDVTYFTSANPYHAMAITLQKFTPTKWRPAEENKEELIHPTANISSSASIGKDVRIAAFVTIQENAVIEDSCIIGENSVIEHGAKLGANTHLFSQVKIARDCVLGKRCVVQSFTVIGSEGFGFAPDHERKFHFIPHRGKVVIGDNVDIGSSSSIDRGTFLDTIISDGCKIDNQVHIGHNCELGENSVLTGGFMVAGSTKIGKSCIFGAGTRIGGHLNICDGVMTAAASAVKSSISEPGSYGGDPLVPVDIYKKNLVTLKKVSEMRSQIRALMKEVFKK